MSTKSLLMISDAKNFWATDDASQKSQIAQVGRDGKIEYTYPNLDHLRNKSILVIFHGFNNTKSEILPAYFKVKDQLDKIVRKGQTPVYDVVIGYRAPLYDSRLEYYEAEAQTKKLAPRVQKHFAALASQANSVDVIAHSMGTRLVFEALKSDTSRDRSTKWINHLFCLAPAVDDESVEKGEVYASAMRKCQDVSIFYSEEDGVLQGLYPLAKFDHALGYAGSEDARKLARNIQQIDCTDIVKGHSSYVDALPLFYFFRYKVLGKIPDPKVAQSLQILADGSVQVLLSPRRPDIQTLLKVAVFAAVFAFGGWALYTYGKIIW